jgi:prepilin-type N-terminal cleavage/methylation domain-containing protein
MRRGFTMIEMLVVLFVGGIILALAIPPWAGWRDRAVVHRAAAELASFYHTARYAAVLRAQQVRVEFDAAVLRAVYEGASDSVFLEQAGPARLGVAFTASRPTIRIAPTGLGWGAANTRLVVTRGTAADTLTTSRLGRLR